MRFSPRGSGGGEEDGPGDTDLCRDERLEECLDRFERIDGDGVR